MYYQELKAMIEVAKAASINIMSYYNKGFNVEIKSDNSPVTEADKTTDELIRKVLSKEFPTYSFLTEESQDNKERLKNDYVFIVDPVDGTEDFVHKYNEFTCNIALVHKHKVVAGVVAVPALNLIYWAVYEEGAYKLDMNSGLISKIHVNDKINNLTVLSSRFHPSKLEEEVLEKHKDVITTKKVAGSSLKALYIAEGSAELSYRLNRGTKEWDTAAFQIIVEEAGGFVLDLEKKPMVYNREDVYNGTYIILNKIENRYL